MSSRNALTISLTISGFLLLWAQGAVFAVESEDAWPGSWPQFRGPEGLAVSNDPNLPEVWSRESANIKWRTEIPGRGNSSPVISSGRVILTTAYESKEARKWQTLIDGACLVLILACILISLAAFARRLSAKDLQGVPLAKRALKGWPHTLIALITSLLFFFLVLLATVWRGHSEAVFAKLGLFAANRGYPDMEHLFSVDEGLRASVWLTTGGIAFFGLAVAVGRIRAQSIWRLLAAGAVMLSAKPFIRLTPTDQWKEDILHSEKMAFMIPALILAAWHLVNYIKIGFKQSDAAEQSVGASPDESSAKPPIASRQLKICWKPANIWRIGPLLPFCSAIILAVISLLVFIPPNFYEARLGMQRVVLCLDEESGKMLWAQPVFVAPSERKHSDSTYATPTVATDGTYIIANFGVGVACLDFEGKVRWKKWDTGYFKNSRYGASSSPILAGDKAIVVQEAEEHSTRPTWIAAFDKRTSRTHWRINPENIRGCYTTPTIYRHSDGIEQLIIASLGNVASYDVETGKFLWMVRIPTDQLVASIARSGDLFCIDGGTWGPNATVMMRMTGAPSGRARLRKLWQSDEPLTAPTTDCSPVIYEGKLFTINDRGRMNCFDAVSGKEFWSRRLRSGRYLSSLIAGDGKVYACSTKGLTTVVAADEEFKVIAENDLKGRCYATPAIAESRLFLRIDPYLYCIEKERP
ncbi:MAG: outer membrane protein assembly factor BamB family protein [Planctomycetota bacterium]|jgi:outer membrane protein assembly factor BamB